MSIRFLSAALFLTVFACKPSAEFPTSYSVKEDSLKVIRIFAVLDKLGENLDSTMNVFSDDLVHMAQGNRAITDKAELRKLLERETSYGKTTMVHELITINSYPGMVLTRGSAKGTWTPPEGDPIRFRNK